MRAAADALRILAMSTGVKDPDSQLHVAVSSHTTWTYDRMTELGVLEVTIRLFEAIKIKQAPAEAIKYALTPLAERKKWRKHEGTDRNCSSSHSKAKNIEYMEAYTKLGTLLGGNSRFSYWEKARDALLPRAADEIMKLVPPPEWSEADEAAWEPFLKGKKGDD